jgi:hypothetical protein
MGQNTVELLTCCSILACVAYYWLWIHGIPYFRGYKIREEVVTLEDGSKSHQLVKVPNAEVEEWDRTHDHAGRLITEAAELSDKTTSKVLVDGKDVTVPSTN